MILGSQNEEGYTKMPESIAEPLAQYSFVLCLDPELSLIFCPSFANPLQKINCQDYRIILRKDLTNSDVGNIGRIVLPKVSTCISS